MKLRPPERWHSYWPIPLRLVVGGALAVAGAFKVFTSLGHQNIAHELLALGVPAPELMAWVVGIAELLCGLGILLGAFTRICSLIMIANLGGLLVLAALAGISRPEALALNDLGFPYRLPSIEAATVLIAASAALWLGGGGPWSVERRN